MNNASVQVSVVIPAYNEEGRIGASLDKILTFFPQSSLSFEIVVVDDGSRDQTIEVCQERLRHVRHQLIPNDANRGKGYSVRKGASGVATYYYAVVATASLINSNITSVHTQGIYVEGPSLN